VSQGATGSRHTPVMLEKSIELLNVRPGLIYVDATAGAGGHLREILKRAGGRVKVVGIDRDAGALAALSAEIGGQSRLVHGNYRDIAGIVQGLGIDTVDGGILADLGVSSMQLDNPERGFSFLKEGPLDMRMDSRSPLTAERLVNTLPERELADIIFRYGEERASRKIARAIVSARPLATTTELAALVARCLRAPRRAAPGFRDSSHPATRTFQALRIAVNDELGSLERFLRDALQLLSPGARLVVITFHSLEDRLVKQIFRKAAQGCICPPRQPVCTCNHRPELLIITRKPVLPDEKEVLANPRSRSAKLRAGQKEP